MGPVGADLQRVEKLLADILAAELRYACTPIRMSDMLRQFTSRVWKPVWASFDKLSQQPKDWWAYAGSRSEPPASGTPEHIRIKALMDAGRSVREQPGPADVLVQLAVARIADARRPNGAQAFIVRSLKHPDEVTTLRRLYGPSFVLVGAHSRDDARRDRISTLLQKTSGLPLDAWAPVTEYLVGRDSYETATGQRVRDTFHRADVFIDTDAPDETVREQLRRFVRLLFGDPHLTPRRDEYAMFLAHSAAIRSASLARQVGAVLTQQGEVIALGANETPRPGGGLLFEGERWSELRDLKLGFDTNERERRRLIEELLARLGTFDYQNAIRKLQGTRVLSLIEFYREVHAEAAALLDAARRGIATSGSTLSVTTFPCHDCAKHIITAGVSRVVYLEPYEKSKALQFFGKAFTRVTPACDGEIILEPFVGIGPRLHRDLFSMTSSEGIRIDRKDADGNVAEWAPRFRWRAWDYGDDELLLTEKVEALQSEKWVH